MMGVMDSRRLQIQWFWQRIRQLRTIVLPVTIHFNEVETDRSNRRERERQALSLFDHLKTKHSKFQISEM